MTWKFRQYQEEVIEHVIAGGGVGLIALPLGSGKTAIAVEIVRRMLSGPKTVLVIAPINTHTGWSDHFNTLMHSDVRRIDSTKKGKEAEQALKSNEPGIYIIGWEYNRKMNWSHTILDAVIVDETGRAANRKAKQTLAVHTTKHAPIKLALSATPAGNKIEGIWSTLHWLWPNRFKYFWPFVKQFLTQRPDPYAGMVIIGEKRPGIVAKNIPVYARRTEEEVHKEIPDIVTHKVAVDLSPSQRKIYNKFEQEALAWLDGHPVAVTLPITKMIRLRQVCLAVPTVATDADGEERVNFAVGAKSSKIDALLDIMSDLPVGEKVLVWTHSRRIVPVVLDRLQRAGYSAEGVSGGQSVDARQRALQGFKDGDTQVLVSTIAALGEGVDGLQKTCRVEVWLSKDDNLTLNRQAEGRLRRPGQEHVINRFVIEAVDTIESRQLNRLDTNQTKLENAEVM